MNFMKYCAEFLGTTVLVLIGCGSVVLTGFGSAGPTGLIAISLAFGFAVIGLAYTLGALSGCHLNPAVTVSLWIARRLPGHLVPGYIIAQMLGAALGAAALYLLVTGRLNGYDVATQGLGQTGWGIGYLGEYSTSAAFAAEVFSTFILCWVVLGSTRDGAAAHIAGLAIGLTLTVLLLTFINISGASLNPARSFGPALFVGGKALHQLWLFMVAPIVGGVFAGLLERTSWTKKSASA